MSPWPILFFLWLLALTGADAMAAPACVTSVQELRNVLGDQRASLQWEEISMNDGKPLVVSIFESKGELALEFVKTKEGLWAEGNGAVCASGANLEISFDKDQLRMGPASGWLLRSLLGRGGKFTLTRMGAGQMRIATSGWSGIFVPKSK
ncbi:MAG: hypothetical protein WCK94_13640 [Comamonadaceae bacterium]|jgi:hypothetical protein